MAEIGVTREMLEGKTATVSDFSADLAKPPTREEMIEENVRLEAEIEELRIRNAALES